MSDRRKKFEEDRKKMLSSMGQKPEENIDVSNNKRSEKEYEDYLKKEEDRLDKEEKAIFDKQVEKIKQDNPPIEVFDERLSQITDNNLKFDKHLYDINVDRSPEEEIELRKKHNKEQAEKAERMGEFKSVDGFGDLFSFLNNYQQTGGLGAIFVLYFVFVVLPISFKWFLTTNFFVPIFVAFGLTVIGAVISAIMSLIVRIVVDKAEQIGPRYFCEIRKGSPGISLTMSLINKFWWVFRNAHIFVFIGFPIMLFWSFEWNSKFWLESYLFALSGSLFCSGITWFFFNFFGDWIYKGIVRIVIDNANNVKYRLRYTYEPDKILIKTRSNKKGFVSAEKIQEAFIKDLAGTV